MTIKKYKPLVLQFIKYFGVALAGYVVDFGTLILLTELFSLHYLIAASIGFILGLVVVYILSRKYVFGKSKLKSGRAEFTVFAVIGIIGLGFLNILMWVSTDILMINYMVSKILATFFVYMWNFIARRRFYTE